MSRLTAVVKAAPVAAAPELCLPTPGPSAATVSHSPTPSVLSSAREVESCLLSLARRTRHTRVAVFFPAMGVNPYATAPALYGVSMTTESPLLYTPRHSCAFSASLVRIRNEEGADTVSTVAIAGASFVADNVEFDDRERSSFCDVWQLLQPCLSPNHRGFLARWCDLLLVRIFLVHAAFAALRREGRRGDQLYARWDGGRPGAHHSRRSAALDLLVGDSDGRDW